MSDLRLVFSQVAIAERFAREEFEKARQRMDTTGQTLENIWSTDEDKAKALLELPALQKATSEAFAAWEKADIALHAAIRLVVDEAIQSRLL